MTKRKRTSTVDTPKQQCVNCSRSLSKDTREVMVTEINLNFNYNARKKSMKVVSALSKIFKLGLVNPLFKEEDVENCTKSAICVCESCANILGNLVQYYSQFQSVRESCSFLSKQIEALDKFIKEFGQDSSQVSSRNKVQSQKNTHTEQQQQQQTPTVRPSPQLRKKSPVTKITKNDKPNEQIQVESISRDTTKNVPIDEEEEMENDFEGFCPSPDYENDENLLEKKLHPDCQQIEISGDNVQVKTEKVQKVVQMKEEQNRKSIEVQEEKLSSADEVEELDDARDEDYIVVDDEANDADFIPAKRRRTRVTKKVSTGDKSPKRRVRCRKKENTSTNVSASMLIRDGKYIYNNEWEFANTSEGTFKCGAEDCGKITQSHDSMLIHIRKWHCTGDFKCDTCGKSFISDAVRKTHSCKPHSSCFKYSVDCGDGKFLYRNKWPFEVYTDPEKEGDTVKWFQCGTCQTIRRGRNNISAHIRKIHAEAVSAWICEVCGRSFGNKGCYDSHMQIHSDSEHICDQCGKGFKLKQSLYAHRQAHDLRRYACPFEGCDKVLTTRGGLYFHKQTHEAGGVQQHECPHCHRKFMYKHGLKLHILKNCKMNKTTSTAEDDEYWDDREEEEYGQKKKYYCDYPGCDKVLTTNGGIYFHKKTHECGGVQQNECPLCHRRFMQKHGLKVHMLKYCKKRNIADNITESPSKGKILDYPS